MLANLLHPGRERMTESPFLALLEALAQPEGREAGVVALAMAVAVVLCR